MLRASGAWQDVRTRQLAPIVLSMAPLRAGVFCLPQFEEEELAVASQLLRSEAEFVRKAMTHGDLGLPGKRLLGWWCCRGVQQAWP